MHDLETVHSFGFSFSDVDMIYIEEIAKQCADPHRVIWYLNSFDGGNADIRDKLSNIGFDVRVDSRW